ncbi:MAG: glycosyltransferase family 4 protein [Candidatus Hodarchaeota archaeon]
MHIVYIHQYFATNDGSTGSRSYDVSRHLVKMGHQVTVICGMTSMSGLPPVSKLRPWRIHWIDGIKVICCNVDYSNYMNVPKRLWAFFGFALLSSVVALIQRRINIVFATSTPLTVVVPGILVSKVRRKPYVFEVRDLWPEDLIAAGRMSEGGIGHLIQSVMERASYAAAERVLLVSKGFHDRLLERGYSPKILKTILLGADGELFKKAEPDFEYILKHKLEDKTIAIYSGSHGNANGLYQILDAAEHLRDRPDIAIVMIGDGSEKPNLFEEVSRRNLKNVHLLDPVKKTQLPGILSLCHIGLMILKQIKRPRWVTPNKLFDYMFAGLPVVVNFPGTTADIVENDGVGIACIPGSATDLAEKIRFLADNPGKCKAIGNHAKEVAWQKYERRIIAKQMVELFESI